MDEVAAQGLHCIDVRNSNGDPDESRPRDQYRKIRVLPPIGKQKRLSRADLTVIHAEERVTRRTERKSSGKLNHQICLLAPAPTP